jgi:hypothetical protein
MWFMLSTDGMNPFGERRSTHNTWPMLMAIYNVPPGYVTREFLLLTILIQGPKQPGIDIDVFLEPFVGDSHKGPLNNQGKPA